jgi:phosphoglycerate dehydrogenase-like enzyme
MSKVLIAPMTLVNVDGAFRRMLLDEGFEIVNSPRAGQLTEDELLQALEGISAALAGSEPYTPRVLAAHPQLRVIARAGVGYDAVDVPAATAHGVAVTITPNTNQGAVAEHAFALILALAKNLVAQHLDTVAGRWPRGANVPLRGTTLGLAGLGRIGKAVVERGVAFGMKVIAYEPYPDRDFCARYNVTLVPFEQLLAESDWLSLHIPMTAQSKHLINRKTLGLMKPTAYLINTARGGLVCEADLMEALKSGKLAGAGLDVFEVEPPEGPNPLCRLPNVVVTPHAAGTDWQSRDDMAASAAQAIIALSRGEWPAEKVVNPEVREKFRW